MPILRHAGLSFLPSGGCFLPSCLPRVPTCLLSAAIAALPRLCCLQALTYLRRAAILPVYVRMLLLRALLPWHLTRSAVAICGTFAYAAGAYLRVSTSVCRTLRAEGRGITWRLAYTSDGRRGVLWRTRYSLCATLLLFDFCGCNAPSYGCGDWRRGRRLAGRVASGAALTALHACTLACAGWTRVWRCRTSARLCRSPSVFALHGGAHCRARQRLRLRLRHCGRLYFSTAFLRCCLPLLLISSLFSSCVRGRTGFAAGRRAPFFGGAGGRLRRAGRAGRRWLFAAEGAAL